MKLYIIWEQYKYKQIIRMNNNPQQIGIKYDSLDGVIKIKGQIGQKNQNFQRYCYYQGNTKQNGLNEIPQNSAQNSQYELPDYTKQSAQNHKKMSSSSYNFRCFKKDENYEQIQYETQVSNPAYNSFIRNRYNQIYILDQLAGNRSKTADGTKRCLHLQNVNIRLNERKSLQNNCREKIQPRNIHSRESIQQINRKYKNIRAGQYSAKCLEKCQQNNIPSRSQFKLKGYSKGISPLSNTNNCQKLVKTNLITKQMKKSKSDYEFVASSSSPSHKLRACESNPDNKHITQTHPHNFKSTIKIKSIDDNPNVLANIIKKKVVLLERDQLFEYLQKIMSKGSKKK